MRTHINFGDEVLYCARCRSEEIKVKLPHSPVEWVDAMPEAAFVRRALEVALLGRFSICFSGSAEGYGRQWCRIAQAFKLEARFILPCPCGHLAEPKRGCRCSLARIRTHRNKVKYRKAMETDLLIEVVEPVDSGAASESFRHHVARVEQATLKPLESSQDAEKLLQMARKELSFTARQIAKIRRMASAIACLDLSDTLEAAHIAEAIQYLPRINPI